MDWHWFIKMNQNIQTSSKRSTFNSNHAPQASTSRMIIQLNSSLQGYLKTVNKLTRNLEKANHHSELSHTTVITDKPPKGLIPRRALRIPDPSTEFIVHWKGCLQVTAIKLTKLLKEYWSERAATIQQKLDPLLATVWEKYTNAQKIWSRQSHNRQPETPTKN